jgi:hypothetical protein
MIFDLESIKMYLAMRFSKEIPSGKILLRSILYLKAFKNLNIPSQSLQNIEAQKTQRNNNQLSLFCVLSDL